MQEPRRAPLPAAREPSYRGAPRAADLPGGGPNIPTARRTRDGGFATHGRHLLLIEDEPAIADFLAENLRHDDVRVTTVGSVGEAALQLRRQRPDILLVDIALPDGSGLDLCRRVRDGELGDPDVGIIFLTARAEEQDRVRGFHRGADDYVVKPFTIPSCWRASTRCTRVWAGAGERRSRRADHRRRDVAECHCPATACCCRPRSSSCCHTGARPVPRPRKGRAPGARLGLPHAGLHPDPGLARLAPAPSAGGPRCGRRALRRESLGRRLRAALRRASDGTRRRLVVAVCAFAVTLAFALGPSSCCPSTGWSARSSRARPTPGRSPRGGAAGRCRVGAGRRGAVGGAEGQRSARRVPAAAAAMGGLASYARRTPARPSALAVRAVGDGRLVVVRIDRGGAIERRERSGLASASCSC